PLVMGAQARQRAAEETLPDPGRPPGAFDDHGVPGVLQERQPRVEPPGRDERAELGGLAPRAGKLAVRAREAARRRVQGAVVGADARQDVAQPRQRPRLGLGPGTRRVGDDGEEPAVEVDEERAVPAEPVGDRVPTVEALPDVPAVALPAGPGPGAVRLRVPGPGA